MQGVPGPFSFWCRGDSQRQKAQLQTQDLSELGTFSPWSVLHNPGVASYLAGENSDQLGCLPLGLVGAMYIETQNNTAFRKMEMYFCLT